jgi:hypothetical protein
MRRLAQDWTGGWTVYSCVSERFNKRGKDFMLEPSFDRP